MPLSLLQIFEDRPPQILFLGWRSAVVIIDESLFNIFEIFLANIDEMFLNKVVENLLNLVVLFPQHCFNFLQRCTQNRFEKTTKKNPHKIAQDPPYLSLS